MIKYIAMLTLVAAAGCASHAAEPMTPEAVEAAAKDGIVLVENEHIVARQAENPDLLIVDVRTEAEFRMARIPGARWIPRGKSEFEFAKSVRDADTEIILYCRTGSRAALVKKALDAQGYQNVSAHQGFETWAQAELPLENDLGLLKLIEKASN